MISRGSEWHRWEPHIHAPGTILNNQFGATDPWETYLTTLEGLVPKIEAIAVTDYYVTDTYEEFLKRKAAGRLRSVQLLFPNIELRLDVAAKSGFVNTHLLVSPEDPEHLVEVKRILKRLQFHAYNDRFDCTRDELIKLGKRADPAITDDDVALRHGATQFKVNFDQLRKVINESEWAKKNILIAVAGGAGDGTSGVRQAADTTVRQEIEKFSHIIFSSSPAQREFWLGQRSGMTVEGLHARYDGCKPCLHGSDSHDQKSVGQPVDNRFSWIKGALEFDALRQACIDPEGRAYVGEQGDHENKFKGLNNSLQQAFKNSYVDSTDSLISTLPGSFAEIERLLPDAKLCPEQEPERQKQVEAFIKKMESVPEDERKFMASVIRRAFKLKRASVCVHVDDIKSAFKIGHAKIKSLGDALKRYGVGSVDLAATINDRDEPHVMLRDPSDYVTWSDIVQFCTASGHDLDDFVLRLKFGLLDHT